MIGMNAHQLSSWEINKLTFVPVIGKRAHCNLDSSIDGVGLEMLLWVPSRSTVLSFLLYEYVHVFYIITPTLSSGCCPALFLFDSAQPLCTNEVG